MLQGSHPLLLIANGKRVTFFEEHFQMENALNSLLEDLRSGDPAIRFSVLPRLDDLTWTSASIEALRSLLASEDNPAVREPLTLVLGRLEKKTPTLHAGKLVQKIEILLEDPSRDDLVLVLWLEKVSLAEAPLVSMALREARWSDFPSHSLPAILRYFGKFGSFEDCSTIEGFCRHPDPKVLSAAVEALEKLNPESLKGLIVPLLVNPVPGIRSRAVRLLYRWDPQEALRHFDSLMFSEDPREREAALAHGIFYPFQSIRDILLRFLALETDLDLLRRGGALFAANPTLEGPIRLMEIRNACLGEKRAVLQEIMTVQIQALFDAGLTATPPLDFMEDLEKIWRERQGGQIFEQLSAMLDSGDPELRRTAAQALDSLKAYSPDAVRILAGKSGAGFGAGFGAGSTASSGADASSGSGTASAPKDPPSDSQDGASLPEKLFTPDSFTRLSPADRVRLLDALDPPSWKILLPLLAEFIGKASKEEKRAVANCAKRLGRKSEIGLLCPLLLDADGHVVSAAVEAIGSLDPEMLGSQFSQLLRHPEDEVRASALRVLVGYDKQHALSLVETMMFAAQNRQRSLAILSTAHFDFPTVRDLILKALEIEKLEENLRQLGAILKAHIDEPLLLEFLVRARSRREHLPSFWEVLSTDLATRIAKPGETPTQLLARLEGRIDKEQADGKLAPKPYSLPAIQTLRKRKAGNQSVSQGAIANTTDRARPGHSFPQWISATFLALFLAAGSWCVLTTWHFRSDPNSGISSGEPTATATASPTSLTGNEVFVEGAIVFIDPSGQGVLINGEKPEATKYFIQFGQVRPQTKLQKGQRFGGRVRLVGRERQTTVTELLASDR